MIIPQIVDNKTRSNTLKIPIKCPFCSEATKVVQENESKVLMCTNDNCSGKLLSRFTHFVSKNAMNIEGMSESTLKKFIDCGYLEGFSDIYDLDIYKDAIKVMDGFGERSYNKLWSAIQESKKTSMSKLIYALGINNIGRTASKEISKYFKNNWLEFLVAIEKRFDFSTLNDFGATMNKSIYDYFKNPDSDKWWRPLISKLNMKQEEQQSHTATESKINGLIFVITGSVEHYKNRDELKEFIESLGGKVSGSVSAKTDYLINNDVTSTSGKNAKAKSLNIPVISEHELINMIKR